MYNNNVEVEVSDFTCCGRLYYLLGKEKEYNKIVEKNKNIIDNSKYDYIIFDCATCYDTVLNYENIDTSKMIMAEDFLDKLVFFKCKLNYLILLHFYFLHHLIFEYFFFEFRT